VYTGGNAVEINTEADSTDMTEFPYDDKPSTGMFWVFLTLNVFKQQTQLSLERLSDAQCLRKFTKVTQGYVKLHRW